MKLTPGRDKLEQKAIDAAAKRKGVEADTTGVIKKGAEKLKIDPEQKAGLNDLAQIPIDKTLGQKLASFIGDDDETLARQQIDQTIESIAQAAAVVKEFSLVLQESSIDAISQVSPLSNALIHAATMFSDLDDEQVLGHASSEQIDVIRASSVTLLQVIEQNGKAIEKKFEDWKLIAKEVAATDTSFLERHAARKMLEKMDWANSATQLFLSQAGRLLSPEPIDRAELRFAFLNLSQGRLPPLSEPERNRVRAAALQIVNRTFDNSFGTDRGLLDEASLRLGQNPSANKDETGQLVDELLQGRPVKDAQIDALNVLHVIYRGETSKLAAFVETKLKELGTEPVAIQEPGNPVLDEATRAFARVVELASLDSDTMFREIPQLLPTIEEAALALDQITEKSLKKMDPKERDQLIDSYLALYDLIDEKGARAAYVIQEDLPRSAEASRRGVALIGIMGDEGRDYANKAKKQLGKVGDAARGFRENISKLLGKISLFDPDRGLSIGAAELAPTPEEKLDALKKLSVSLATGHPEAAQFAKEAEVLIRSYDWDASIRFDNKIPVRGQNQVLRVALDHVRSLTGEPGPERRKQLADHVDKRVGQIVDYDGITEVEASRLVFLLIDLRAKAEEMNWLVGLPTALADGAWEPGYNMSGSTMPQFRTATSILEKLLELPDDATNSQRAATLIPELETVMRIAERCKGDWDGDPLNVLCDIEEGLEPTLVALQNLAPEVAATFQTEKKSADEIYRQAADGFEAGRGFIAALGAGAQRAAQAIQSS